MMTARTPGVGLALIATVIVSGCSSTATSNTARTAREQLLISNAVDQSLAKVNFNGLKGTRVYVEEKYLESVDKPYILGSLRHHVLRAGSSIVGKVEDADVILEVRSGGVGTDMSEKYIGIPEIALPGMLAIPEIRLAENKAQQGYAKIGLAVLDAQSNQLLGQGGVSMARSDDSKWYVMGIGPFENGTIRSEIDDAAQRPAGMRQREMPRNVAVGGSMAPSLNRNSPYQLTSGQESSP